MFRCQHLYEGPESWLANIVCSRGRGCSLLRILKALLKDNVSFFTFLTAETGRTFTKIVVASD
jgi:hypothetical protein